MFSSLRPRRDASVCSASRQVARNKESRALIDTIFFFRSRETIICSFLEIVNVKECDHYLCLARPHRLAALEMSKIGNAFAAFSYSVVFSLSQFNAHTRCFLHIIRKELQRTVGSLTVSSIFCCRLLTAAKNTIRCADNVCSILNNIDHRGQKDLSPRRTLFCLFSVLC